MWFCRMRSKASRWATSTASALGGDGHVSGDRGSAGADELPVDLDHAGVAGLDGAHRRQIADLGNFFGASGLAMAVEGVDEKLTCTGGDGVAVDEDLRVRGGGGGRV